MNSHILEVIDRQDWKGSFSSDLQSQSLTALESGKILLFPKLPFLLLPEENKFISSNYIDAKAKNISMNSMTQALSGTHCTGKEYEDFKVMMQRYASYAENLIRQLLSPYSSALQIGRTSFRPVEISGRASSYRKDDTRLHVDSFPATPCQGRRILRVFTNVNPDNQDRVWRVGEPFMDVARHFLPKVSKDWLGKSALLKMLKITKTYRTQYDHIMLQIHDRMKADLSYQKTVPQSEVRFAPGNSWIVQTDHVSHAAMSGQYLFEQTFYLPVQAMVDPEQSPLRVLEKLTGKVLV